MNLRTNYLGLSLRTPLVPSASPLSESLDNLKQMEDAGASAVVLHSLFEEQIRYERYELNRILEQGSESYPEALSYFSEPIEFELGPEAYLRHIQRAKAALAIPIIASLNGTTPNGWTSFARQMQEAGADALELNLYHVPTDLDLAGAEIEQRYLNVVRAVRAEVSIPLSIKISPYFTNIASMARQLVEAGADGLVLFNRFFQPDIDLESREVTPHVFFSTASTLRLPLRWIALLYGRIAANLAGTGGVHEGTDAIKLLMAGANVTMLCSALLLKGINHLRQVESEMTTWLEEHEYESVAQLQGSLSHKNAGESEAFERAQYMRAIGVYHLITRTPTSV